MHPFAAAFLSVLIIATLLRFWLAARHIRHVRAHRGRVPDGFDGKISLEAHAKAADYTVAKTRLGNLDAIAGVLLTLWLTFGGGLQLLSTVWAGIAQSGGIGHGIALIGSVVLISSLADLPFHWYRTFVIEQRFGFNRMTLRLFVADLAKQAAVGAAFGLPLIACVLWLMERMGSQWWIWTWITWIAFNLLVVAIYPTVIAPWFNKFSPLEDQALRARIETLLEKCGFRSQGLFVMDSSRRSSHGNAYFTGFGAAKRIVLFDTLIARLAPAEIEAVLAHELGHFSHRHVIKRMALLFAASFGMLAAAGWLLAQEWFFTALGITNGSTATGLILFFLVMPPFTFLLGPLASLYSRSHEFEADAYAARHADPKDLIRALVKLYQDNAATLTPDPLHSAFYDSHPPAVHRIERLQAVH